MKEISHNNQTYVYDYDKMTIGQIEKVLTLHELAVDYSQLTPTTATEHQKILSSDTKVEIFAHLLIKKIGDTFTYDAGANIEFVRNLPAKFHTLLNEVYNHFLSQQGQISPQLMKSINRFQTLLNNQSLSEQVQINQNLSQSQTQEKNSTQNVTKIKSMPKT
jgi:hypothetical protein